MKKIRKLKEWLKTKHESAIDTHDYTREMVFREVMMKLGEIE